MRYQFLQAIVAVVCLAAGCSSGGDEVDCLVWFSVGPPLIESVVNVAGGEATDWQREIAGKAREPEHE